MPDLFGHGEPQQRAEPRVLSVSELTRNVRAVIEDNIGVVWVEGEISNLRKQASGHQYFTLKDETSQLACVLFARPGNWRRAADLADGMRVQVRGQVTVYEARGQYQMNVQLVQPAGEGLLQAKFEALKRRLDAEGLFDPARKRALPRFPATVAMVTSPTGAAIRDMLNVLARRAPWVRVLVSPVRVQGEGAAEEIAAALGELNRAEELGLPVPDVIIAGRGGGSIEDLWAFNEEIVARAIAASAIPVVSAVGHEIDFTIADFVADLRAPTPSAAAELVVPDGAQLTRFFAQAAASISRCAEDAIERSRNRLAFLAQSAVFREPRLRLDAAAQRLDLLLDAMARSGGGHFSERKQRLAALAAQLRHFRPDQLLALQRHRFAAALDRFRGASERQMERHRRRLDRAADVVRLLSPKATLARGYTITRGPDGGVLRSAADAAAAGVLKTQFPDGETESRVDRGAGSAGRKQIRR